MSAQQLANRCAALGAAGLTRLVITNLETGRRAAVTVPELVALAAALETAPLLLLYPVGIQREVEYLPGRSAETWAAARWWTGEYRMDSDGALLGAARVSPIPLLADHNVVLAELAEVPGGVTQARYLRARRRQFDEDFGPDDRKLLHGVVALHEIRQLLQDADLKPPELPSDLTWVDEGG
jgi:hypothetical protein